jgi:hypothetical protein
MLWNNLYKIQTSGTPDSVGGTFDISKLESHMLQQGFHLRELP